MYFGEHFPRVFSMYTKATKMMSPGEKNSLSMILVLVTEYAHENAGAHLKMPWSNFQFCFWFELRFFPLLLLAVSLQPSSEISILKGFVWDAYLRLSRTH